jgi:hypothetical protein
MHFKPFFFEAALTVNLKKHVGDDHYLYQRDRAGFLPRLHQAHQHLAHHRAAASLL